MQTKKQSFLEACTNTAIGFVVSYASTFLILPLVGVQTSAGTNLVITIYFTIISILRGYIIRRWFNKKKPNTWRPPAPTLFCFECETNMPFKEKDGEPYCINCGLVHNHLKTR